MDSVAVVTMTRAERDEDARLLTQSLLILKGRGLPVFVSDRGAVELSVEGIDIAREGDSLVQQVQASMGRAIDAGFETLIYTEPDKQEFFQSGLTRFLERSAADAVTVASRDVSSMETFPGSQQVIENSFNVIASDFLGVRTDFLYGPLVLPSRFMRGCLDELTEDLGWGWRPFVLARAHRAGCRSGCTAVISRAPIRSAERTTKPAGCTV